MGIHYCSFCQEVLTHVFVDLGVCPPSNAFLEEAQCDGPEVFYPLKVFVCQKCLLVQVPEYKAAEEIFTPTYAYFSSYSPSWVRHAQEYVQAMAARFALGQDSFVIEIGSNDGYLLQHFVDISVPCLGIDPSVQAAKEAEKKGVHTLTAFFTHALAETLRLQGKQADLICGINVFAHVPNINDFVAGVAHLLTEQGVMTMEIPHILQLLQEAQFDTIYHEHFFYHSLFCVQAILARHGLRVFDVQTLPTHGGSMRIFACKQGASHAQSGAVAALLREEEAFGLRNLSTYLNFQEKIDAIRFALMRFLMQAKEDGKKVVGYGAAAKGNTLINYFGIRKDLLSFVVDASPYKQGLFLPGSRIPVVAEQKLREEKPDYVLILPWNLQEEISQQLQYVRQWGGMFVTAVPSLRIW